MIELCVWGWGVRMCVVWLEHNGCYLKASLPCVQQRILNSPMMSENKVTLLL